jgi:hypothetical protein
VQPIGVSVDPTTKVPTYTFNGTAKTFNYDASLLSRWQAQFGLRYILVYSKISKKPSLKKGFFLLILNLQIPYNMDLSIKMRF